MVLYYESYPGMFPNPRHHVQNYFPAPYTQSQTPQTPQVPPTHQFHQEMSPCITQFPPPPMDPAMQWGPPTNPSVYTTPSSCSRPSSGVFVEDWTPRSPCAHHGGLGTGGAANTSPGIQYGQPPYKLMPDFSQPQPPPQDLSVHGQHGQHSPDSGLTVSSDGVSSSDSPGQSNGHVFAVHHQMQGQQGGLRPPLIRSPFDWIKKPSYQTQTNPGKTRTKDKYRVVYSDLQRLELEKEFHYSRYITIRRKAELAQLLGLSERQVKIWFQNRRAKERKQVKKREEMVQKEKDIAVHHHHHHHLPQLQMPGVTNGLANKVIAME